MAISYEIKNFLTLTADDAHFDQFFFCYGEKMFIGNFFSWNKIEYFNGELPFFTVDLIDRVTGNYFPKF